MPSVKARAFLVAFEQTLGRTLQGKGRLSQDEVDTLERAAKHLRDPQERAAANDVLALFRHDRILDRNEVDPARAALAKLVGVSTARLPAALEKVLTHAVPVPNVRVHHYDLTFDFSKDAASFPARAVIKLEKPAPKTCILEIDPERLDIDDIKVGGKSVPFSVKNGRLHVQAPGAERLDIHYHVTPTDDVNGYGLIRDRDLDRMWTLTWPYNTGALFPSASRPDDGATARVTVHAQAGHEALSAGKADKHGTFHLKDAVPAHAISVVHGKFTDGGIARRGQHEVRTIGLGNEMAPKLRKEVRETVANALDYLSGWLGEYRFGERLNLVEIKSEYGGMENAGAVAIGVGQNRRDTIESAVHEAVHHWFGDGVHIEHWGELWMSEGFTNYTTWRFFQHANGDRELFKYLDDAKSTLKEQLDEKRIQPLTNSDDVDPKEGLSWTPYMQGAWMLRMLEVQLGTPKMDSLLRAWFQKMNGDAATTDEFIAFVKKESNVDVKSFFAAWARLERIPTFRDKSTFSKSSVELRLDRVGVVPEGIRVPVVILGKRGERVTVTVEPNKTIHMDAGFPIRALSWDPERTVLCEVK